jgi:hypothetical protein
VKKRRIPLDELPQKGKSKIKRNKDGTFDLPDGTTIDDSNGVYRNVTDIDTLIDKIRAAENKSEESKTQAPETPKRRWFIGTFDHDPLG